MPKITGMKGHAISACVRDIPEGEIAFGGNIETSAFGGIPERGVRTSEDLSEDELQPHFFVPNFVRPMPEAEEDPDLNEDQNLKDYDVSADALYLVPGMLPEPYWDYNMVCDKFNYA